MPRYLLALDQGTTSSRAMLFDEAGRAVAIEQREFPQSFPHPGWVEHDPETIWSSQLEAARAVLRHHGVTASEVTAIGITNQRETAVVWDRTTGEPIYPAIVWQSRQTAAICDDLRARGLEAHVRERTGLRIDAYFSATKVRFILDAVPGAQARAERGELAFGTVDAWLLHRLTNGRVHATDETNACRTMLYDIHAHRWDDALLAALEIPHAMLPGVRPSSGDFSEADVAWFGAPVPIRGVAGDQQAALFGQGCIADGGAKNTYGTGCFMLTHTGSTARPSGTGLLTTIAARTAGEAPAYALEGSVFVAGAAVQWLRDGLGLVRSAAETEAIARSVPDAGGVYLVPAFAGLGAPYWDEAARGTIVGLTRGSGAAHIVRATLESIAYQTRDLVECFAADAGRAPVELRVDGGACRNDFLMQFQADILGIPVRRPVELEVTALGAAGLAGIASGVWGSAGEFAAATCGDLHTFEPRLPAEQREVLHAGWLRAVERARGWAVD